MRKLRGSKLVVQVFRHRKLNPIWPILGLVRCFKSKSSPKALAIRVPKGYLAVYVGEPGEAKKRVLIPLVHLNHLQFRKLLDESQKEYGFNYPGPIDIPCTFSQFQRVYRRIGFQTTAQKI